MSESECVGYAEQQGRDFLGSSPEPLEPAGCLQWKEKKVEFNSHVVGFWRRRNAPACDALKGGACICAERRAAAAER